MALRSRKRAEDAPSAWCECAQLVHLNQGALHLEALERVLFRRREQRAAYSISDGFPGCANKLTTAAVLQGVRERDIRDVPEQNHEGLRPGAVQSGRRPAYTILRIQVDIRLEKCAKTARFYSKNPFKNAYFGGPNTRT